MVTPRRTRLIRTATLGSFQAAISHLVHARRSATTHDPIVLVPTRAGAEHLRRTLGWPRPAPSGPSVQLLTRDEWYRVMASQASETPLLSDLERYVHMLSAARTATGGGATPPFNLRPV